ncbi:MAG TPA: BamA/TamA family outer membrane protein [Longimicrobium sp.]|nr:BamA/TamA family outer membrane protein [Longimicrobium sp.]
MRRVPLLLAAMLFAAPLAAQAGEEQARVAAGPQYRAGALKRALLGRSYRELWTTPVAVPVLDLGSFAGGLTPTETGGGNQTLSLRFRGADGKDYAFREVDKNPGRGQGGRGGIGGWVLQDQVSSQNPAGALVAGRLMDATGALHVDPALYVMPDDPRLGEFREEFAGMLGQIEERSGDGFGGAAEVLDTEEFITALQSGPADRLAAEEYLTVRLMDFVLGDWDRHEDQYEWARFDQGGVRLWRPIPRDRDYVFVDYDGLLIDLARPFFPKAVRYRPSYGNLFGLIQQAQYLDRRLLGELDRAAWDSVAVALRARVTDALIDDAVRRMPAEYQAIEGARLAATLRARRDALPQAAAAYYGMMAREPEAYGTDAGDLAIVERTDGGVEVRIHPGGSESAAPVFRRRFAAGETREVRIFLLDGADRAEVRGSGGMLVRVIGGEGADRLEDRGRGRTAFYDAAGETAFVRGANTVVDTRPFQRRESITGAQTTLRPPRDWGTDGGALTPYAAVRPFADLVVGAGPSRTRYGFRRDPYAERWLVRGLWAPLYTRFGAEARYTRRWTGNQSYGYVFGRASELEGVYFTGFGNETSDDAGLREYIVWERQALLEPGVVIDRGGGLFLSLNGVLRYTEPEVDPGTPADTGPLGTDPYVTAGVRGGAAWLRTDSAAWPTRGWTLAAEGGAFPYLSESVAGHGTRDGSFWRAGARGAFYLPLGTSVLALRAGGEKVWGDFPIQYAALLGGSPTLRGYSFQRYAGDASAFGGAELRVPLLGSVGALGLADAGRVWFNGGSEGGWHTGVGAGAYLRAGAQTLSVFYARGERNIVYLRLGLPF